MAGKRAHNAVFLALYLPYGISNGFFTVTLAFLLAQSGVGTVAIAGIAGLCLLPLTWSFVWAPVTDTTLSYKGWYAIAALVVGGGVMLAGFLPAQQSSLLLFDILAFVTALAATFVGQVTSALAAHNSTDEGHGGAAGWMAAGNIGGGGLGGGLGLWLAHHFPQLPWLAAMTLGGICIAAAGALLFIREPVHLHRDRRILATLANIGRDVWAMARSRKGLIAIVLLLMPMGTGASAGLWSAVAGGWHAGADVVALSAGVVGGILSAAGSFLMGHFTTRIGPKQGYVGGAFLMALITLAMAAAPKTPETFMIGTLAYAFVNGFMYASFYAVMLEAIGKGCAATKAPVMSCLTNIPILVVTMVDGNAQAHFGATGMLVTEAAMSIAAIAVFSLFLLALRSRPVAVPAAS